MTNHKTELLCSRKNYSRCSYKNGKNWIYRERQRMGLPSLHQSEDWIKLYSNTWRLMPMAPANTWADGYNEAFQNHGPRVRSHPRHVVVNRMRRGDLRL